MAEDAFVTDFEHIMADDITDDVRFIMYDSASGKTASAGEVNKYMMKNIHVDTTLTEEGSAADAKAVGGALAKKADTKGRYEDIVAGGAEQLMADGHESDTEPYFFRPTGGSADVGNREYVDKIVGGTVAWNQLCNSSSVTVQSGHKYLLKKGTAWSIGASTETAITGLTSGSDMLIDLTAMFGTTIADHIYSLEQSQAGAGVAWFRNYFPKDYYPYDPGTLRSVEGVNAHEMVGFNKWDEEWEVGSIDPNTGKNLSASDRIRSNGYIPVLPNTVYGHNVGMYVYQYDANKNFLSPRSEWKLAYTLTTSPETRYIRFISYSTYGTTYKNDICINLSDPTRNGEYEPYQKHTYPLDSSLTLRGIPKLVDWKLEFDGDIYPPSGEVQRRYGLRAYQSGDESLSDAITDGTNTVYKLATPTTETAEGYEHYQICDPSGTEEFVTTGIVPVGHETRYPHDLKKKIETAPDSPSTDGTYLMKRSGGKNTYMALPSTPSANGAYVLTVTVSGGTSSYSWTKKE